MPVPQTADIFQPKSESLTTLLQEIDRHKTALPNFQREWVWDPSMVRDLVVSVANRYPAGSLLTMPNTGDRFALRPFSGAGDVLRTEPTLMILDGQQRLTSLYQALFSTDGIRDAQGKTSYLYLDVARLLASDGTEQQTEATIDEAIFIATVNKAGQRVRSRSLRVFDDLTGIDNEIAHGAMPLSVVFNDKLKNQWLDAYVDHHDEWNKEEFRQFLKEWEDEVAPWLDRIRDYRFPVIELNKDMDLHAICYIFEKVNSTGVALTVFELCTAILWAQGLRLNDTWKETRNRLKREQILRMQGELEGATFLQVISLLSTLSRKRSSAGGRVAVSCRREELLQLSRETVEEWWPVAEQGYREASRFMANQGILSARVLPYTTLLLPLAAVLGYVGHADKNAVISDTWDKIARWYWCSVFTQRYSGSVETSAALDFEQLLTWIEGGDEPDAVRTFTFQADRLQEVSTVQNAIFKGILCLLAKHGAIDFSGQSKLSVDLDYLSKLDHHHIFPTKALESLGIVDRRKNSIVNKTLISATANRKISGRMPATYIATMNDRIGDERTTEILRSHLINRAALENNDWNEFYLSRREELRHLVSAECGGTVQEFSDGKQVPLPKRVLLITTDVSAIERRLRALIAQRIDDDWTRVPQHLRVRSDDRITAALANNPGLDPASLRTASSRLTFSDLRELEAMITSKLLWPLFVDVFKNKETLPHRFGQIAAARNAAAHLREIDQVTAADAEAGIAWFNAILNRAEAAAERGDAPLPYDEDDDDDAAV